MRKFAQFPTNLAPMGEVAGTTYKDPHTGEYDIQTSMDLYNQNHALDAIYYDISNKRYESIIDTNLNKINYPKGNGTEDPKDFKNNVLIPAILTAYNLPAVDENVYKKAAGITLLARFATDHKYTLTGGMLNELLGDWEDPIIKKVFSTVFNNIAFPSHDDIPNPKSFDFAESLKATNSELGKQVDMFSMGNNLDNVLFTRDVNRTVNELSSQQQIYDFNKAKKVLVTKPNMNDFGIYSKDNYTSGDLKDLANTGPEDWVIVVSKNKNNAASFRAKFKDLLQIINPGTKFKDLIARGVKNVGTITPGGVYMGDLNKEIVK